MMFKTFFVFFFLFNLLFPKLLNAQIDTSLTHTVQEQAIEDFINSTEIEGQLDMSSLTEILEEFKEKPINLNNASEEDLRALPGMNGILINHLQEHIERFGKLGSVFELQAVKGFDRDLIYMILPFCKVSEAGPKDISPGTLHPAGPDVSTLIRGLEGDFIQRTIFQLEKKRGYLPPDTLGAEPEFNENGDSTGLKPKLSSHYSGDRFRHYSRFRIKYKHNFSMGLTGEKDPGEMLNWNPERKMYAYDFLSAHISVQNFGVVKAIAIGDYTLQFGQGLVFSKGLGFGKGAETINTIRMPESGVKPYTSVNENLFQRGIASTYAWNNIYFTGFYSSLSIDGNLVEGDSLASPKVSSVPVSGLHRTGSELSSRKANHEKMYGGRIALKRKYFQLGINYYRQVYKLAIDPRPNHYNSFAFRGRQNILGSIDFDWVYQNFNLFGEFARSSSGGNGIVFGIMGSLAPRLDFALHLRNFSKDFHSRKAYVFAERPTNPGGESGIYLGIKVKPSTKWSINSFFDMFLFSWNKFKTAYPSYGYDFLLKIEYKASRRTQVYAQFRSDYKQENASLRTPDQKLDYLTSTLKNALRIHFQTNISRGLDIRNRIEGTLFKKVNEEKHKGILVYQDIIWKPNFNFKLTARYAVFDSPDYSSRIYAYENDIWGSFSIPPYYRKGIRYYLMLTYKLPGNFDVWLRYSQSRFSGIFLEGINNEFLLPASRKGLSNGSGLESIEGNNRSEIKIQLRYKF